MLKNKKKWKIFIFDILKLYRITLKTSYLTIMFKIYQKSYYLVSNRILNYENMALQKLNPFYDSMKLYIKLQKEFMYKINLKKNTNYTTV